MPIEMKEIHSQSEKSKICDSILRALPNWFGIEESIIDYTNQVKEMSFCSAFVDGELVGFVAIKDHNSYTSEICVMGILTDFHRQGIGKELIHWCENYCINVLVHAICIFVRNRVNSTNTHEHKINKEF